MGVYNWFDDFFNSRVENKEKLICSFREIDFELFRIYELQ